MKRDNSYNKGGLNDYLRYSGLGFQIAAIIGVGIFIGYEFDKWFKTAQPYFTLVFAFVFVILALFIGLKDFLKKG